MNQQHNGIDTSGISRQQLGRIERYLSNKDEQNSGDIRDYLRSIARSVGARPGSGYIAGFLCAAVLLTGAAYAMSDVDSAADDSKAWHGGTPANPAGPLQKLSNLYSGEPVPLSKTNMATDMRAGLYKNDSMSVNPKNFRDPTQWGNSRLSEDFGNPKAARDFYDVKSKFETDPFFTIDGGTPWVTRYERANGKQVLPDVTTVDGYIEMTRNTYYDERTGRIMPEWTPDVERILENTRSGETKKTN